MNEKILVPVLGESITEATVAKWLKKEGDTVEADEAIVELETDKVNLEVPSPIDGVLFEINSKDGETVEVGALLGSISQNGVQPAEKKIITKIEPRKSENNVINLEVKKETPKVFKEPEEEDPLILTNEVKEETPLILKSENNEDKPESSNKNKEILSPSVRKIVVENKIDLEKVRGSGKEGRILKGDLISMMGENPQPSERKIKYGQEERIK
ncbi:MAG: E3 binding domain-containing protein, partial [Candidatus Pelagibacter bacterium]